MEHWERLKTLEFCWSDELFRPGLDSFLLGSLPRLRPGLRVCDLGCGTGLLSLLLLQREARLDVTGVEILPEAVSLAEKTVERNRLGDRLRFIQGDLRDALPAGCFDLAVCNPPYYPVRSGAVSEDGSRRSARSEVNCTLPEVCRAAGRLVRWGGRFCLVHKPERMADLLVSLRENGLEAKRLRFACRRAEDAPSLLLLEARRGGKPGLTVERPFVLETPDGHPTPELDRAYFKEAL